MQFLIGVKTMPLPISLDLLKMHEEIPEKLAELSYRDPDKAIVLLRKFGEDKAPISELHKEICICLKEIKNVC